MARGLGLPEAGGLRDQPHRLMLTLDAAQKVYQAISEYERAPAGAKARWKFDHPQLVPYLQY